MYELTGNVGRAQLGQTVTIPNDVINRAWNAQEVKLEQLVAYRGDIRKPPVPLVLSIKCELSQGVGGQTTPRSGAQYIVSPSNGSTPGVTTDWNASRGQGRLEIAYGAYGASQYAVIDIREGAYQLPPCHECFVKYAVYNSTAITAFSGQPATLVASLAAGVHPFPSIPMVSGSHFDQTGAALLMFWTPVMGSYGYQLSVGASPYSVGSIGLIDAQVQSASLRPNLYVDLSTPNYQPGVVEAYQAEANLVELSKTGVDDVWVQIANLVQL